MFKFILSACSLTVFITSFAQPVKPIVHTSPFVHHLLSKNSLKLKHGEPVMRSTSQRVIGQSTEDNFLNSIVDSSLLSYPLNGTSEFDFNSMLYAYNYPYDHSPLFEYAGVFNEPQVMHNKYTRWTINPNTLVYGFYQKQGSIYNSNNYLIIDTVFYHDSLINPNMIATNSFNISGQIIRNTRLTWQGGTADSLFKQFYVYNTSGNILQDSTYIKHLGTWRIVSKSKYYYDGIQNLIKVDHFANTTDTSYLLPLVHQLQYTNTYDASNRLKTVFTKYYDGAALNPYVKDTFDYTGAIPFHTSWKQYQYDPINTVWTPQFYMHKTLNVDGYPQEVYTDTWNLGTGWGSYYKDVYTYNSFFNPTLCQSYIYNFTSFPTSPDFTTKYYYETFTNTTGLNNDLSNETSFTLYPNPASATIQVNGLTLGSSLIINDITGKKVKAITLSSNTIDVSDLTNGVYFITSPLKGKSVKIIINR